jgi:hypothetical protein
VSGNTSGNTPVHLNTTFWDLGRRYYLQYVDRPSYLQFEVTSAGNFTFDACDSLYVANLGLFRGWGPDALANHSNLVAPDRVSARYQGFIAQFIPPGLLAGLGGPARTAWYGGCSMSASARREVFLTLGRYTLQVRGSFWLNDVGGVYVIKLGCGAGAATRLVNKSDPGGMVINPRTGAFSGTPLQVGTDYRMQLHAIDAVQGPTVLAEFNFDVVDPVFALTPRWTGVDAFNATRGIDGQYHVSQVRAVPPLPLFPISPPSVLGFRIRASCSPSLRMSANAGDTDRGYTSTPAQYSDLHHPARSMHSSRPGCLNGSSLPILPTATLTASCTFCWSTCPRSAGAAGRTPSPMQSLGA